MAADWFQASEDILAVARAHEGFKYVDIFEGSVDDDYAVPILGNGAVKPHLIFNFTGLLDRKEGGHSGIVSARYDSYPAQFMVAAVAGTNRDARRLNQMGFDLLCGLVPNAYCGEISPAFFAGVAEISSKAPPTRYGAMQAYDLVVNSQLV